MIILAVFQVTSPIKSTSPSICDKNESSENKKDLSKQLAEWATVKHKITHSVLTDLLHILSPYHPELPLDSCTLLMTPNSTRISDLETGQFVYFGIKNALLPFNSSKLQL